jgi:hypothetical protein
MRRNTYFSILDCSNINNMRTTRNEGPPWALLEFSCIIGIAVRVVERQPKNTLALPKEDARQQWQWAEER